MSIEQRLPGGRTSEATVSFKDGSIYLWQGARCIVLARDQAQGLADFIVLTLQGGPPPRWKDYGG